MQNGRNVKQNNANNTVQPKLYLIPTPIGNLGDITFRAVKILSEVDIILAEDTRTTSFLLKHYSIEKKMFSHHKFNEHKTVEQITQRIAEGQSVALVSDAGTPGISDPGFLLVRTCIENNIEVECLPGATAFVPALVNSGLPCDKFVFEGFLPQKKGRQKRLEQLANEERTMVFYESPFRLTKTLLQFAEVFGSSRKACVSREITKLHEENIRGTLQQLIEHFSEKPPKGEIVITVSGVEKIQKHHEDGE
ncbi:MAG: 16S rRNA (cytidine(1402)-2'-O)-methyltransferase [Prevotellaceae bacterium]|jgi:16S rRNA (cytidine1402-2'-O)-methyltransferase|nr:16S rRNA (cytidine(1402)-2'-O)-methyltransferase [Prevotellaceae bacterium]